MFLILHGSSKKRWISTFYTNVESAVLNNGYMTNWFKPSKGVRQGCPLSPFLFILSAELMSIKLRTTRGSKALICLVTNSNCHNLQTTQIFFSADLISVERALNLVNDFGKMAGLRLNMKKKKQKRFGLESGLTIKPTPWT